MLLNTPGPSEERGISRAESSSERDSSLSSNSFQVFNLSYFHSDLKALYDTQDII